MEQGDSFIVTSLKERWVYFWRGNRVYTTPLEFQTLKFWFETFNASPQQGTFVKDLTLLGNLRLPLASCPDGGLHFL
jgi:hypothetical protein